MTTSVGAGIPQGSPLSPVVFLIVIAKVLEDADERILRQIPTYTVKTYSYVDDFNCTARENEEYRQRGRKPNAITAARKACSILRKPMGGPETWTKTRKSTSESLEKQNG